MELPLSISCIVVVLLLITNLTSATIYPLPSYWTTVNNGSLDTRVKNGDINRIIFLETDADSFALVFLCISGANSYYSPQDRFILSLVTRPYGDPTVWIPVWSANRDHPVGQNATLGLERGSRTLVLRDADGSVVWSLSVASAIASAGIDTSGNFALYNSDNVTVWESFDHPVDTLLPGQALVAGQSLVSAASNSWAPPSGDKVLRAGPSGLALLATQKLYWTVSLLNPTNHCDLTTVYHRCSHFTYASDDLSQGLKLQADFSHTHSPAESSEFCNITLATHRIVTVLATNASQPASFGQFVRLEWDGALRLYKYSIDSRAWKVDESLPLPNSPCSQKIRY